jgi:hypothetical protein
LRKRKLYDVADSFVVARQYALRYKSELIPLEFSDDHRFLSVRGTEVTINTPRKTSKRQVVPIVRKCICKKQGSLLCGACVLRKRIGSKKPGQKHGYVFPQVSYASALYWLRQGASALGWIAPQSWGTHAFRRGWGREAFKAGGLSALFLSGGWRGLAAFGYMSARQRSEVEACDFAVDASDDEDDW